MTVTTFQQLVRERRSIRSFRPEPVSQDVIRSALRDASYSPSNSNIQPWLVQIVSGDALARLSKAMLDAEAAGTTSPDFGWGTDELHGAFAERQKAQGASYFQALGVARSAAGDRRDLVRRNISFFGAPHACFLFMPSFYDHVRTAADVGMYAQTFLLSLTSHGLSGVPQTYLGFFADQVRQVLGVDPALKLLFGISFGTPDITSAASRYRIGRASLDETVQFHD